MPDGGAIPELNASAPKTVGFGVILFGYKGAQFAPSDAPSKEQAQAKARRSWLLRSRISPRP